MRIIDTILDNTGNSIPFAKISDEYYSYHKGNWANYFHQARENLTSLIGGKTQLQQRFIHEIINDLEDIIKAIPAEIPQIITKFTSGPFRNTLNNIDFKKAIKDAFNYKAFRESAKISWLAERYNLKACLYCNAQFALQIGRDGVKKKLLFQFDHFYNADRFPFLSLTLGNLIPTCSSCNISKSDIPFSITTHIHPFHEDANSKFEFYIDEVKALHFLLDKRNYELLKPNIKIIDRRFESHKTVFHIENVYAKHADIVEELILKSLYYNKSKREELNSEFKELNLSQSIIDRFVLGNYTLDSEINKRPLAKLSKDIGKQLKIIKQ